MRARRPLYPLSIGLGFSLVLAFMPLGCGGPAARTHAFVASSAGPDLPGETVAALNACVEEGAGRSDHVHTGRDG